MLRKMTLQAGLAAALIFGAAALFAQAQAKPLQADSGQGNGSAQVPSSRSAQGGTGYYEQSAERSHEGDHDDQRTAEHSRHRYQQWAERHDGHHDDHHDD